VRDRREAVRFEGLNTRGGVRGGMRVLGRIRMPPMPLCVFRVLVVGVCYRGPVATRRYQGSFDHPVRAFFIGMSLLMLLFGGFAVGIEAGTDPRRVADVQTITVDGETLTLAADPKTVTEKELRDGKTKLVRVKGESFTRVVTVTKEGRIVLIGGVDPAEPGEGKPVLPTAVTTLAEPVTLPAETVTLPPETFTETATTTVTETATVTVTETAGDTGSGSTEPSETTP